MAQPALQPLASSDQPEFRAFVLRNHARLERGAITGLPTSPAEYERWLKPPSAGFERVYGLFDSQGRLGGLVGVEFVARFDGAGVWYAVDTAWQGRGWVKTALLTAMLDCSASLRNRSKPVLRWVLHALPGNERSLGLAASLGFVRDPALDYAKHTSARGPGRRLHGFRLPLQAARIGQLLAERRGMLLTG